MFSPFVRSSFVIRFPHFVRSFSTRSLPFSSLTFFGTDSFSVSLLAPLHSFCESHCIRLSVVCPSDKPSGRGLHFHSPPVKDFSLSHSIPLVQLPANAKFRLSENEIEWPKSEVGVVVSFGYFLPNSLIRSFPVGLLNVHPSLVPQYRGASPIQSALLNDEKSTGVSIIGVDPNKIDHGKVYYQSSEFIHQHDNYETLSKRLASQAAHNLLQVLSNLSHYDHSPLLVHPQRNPSNAPKFSSNFGFANFQVENSKQIWLKWRALYGFSSVYTEINGNRIKLINMKEPAENDYTSEDGGKAEPGMMKFDSSTCTIILQCHSGFLRLTELQLAGEKRMNANQFAISVLNKKKSKLNKTLQKEKSTT
jgi:methionyl-tRNA formyltransferase